MGTNDLEIEVVFPQNEPEVLEELTKHSISQLHFFLGGECNCYKHVSCEFDREWLILSFASCMICRARLFYDSFMIRC